jgi:vitamin B12 transporter
MKFSVWLAFFAITGSVYLNLQARERSKRFSIGESSTNIIIQVEAERLAPMIRADQSLFHEISGLMLRSQGEGTPQTDLSIRGGSFSSAGVTIGKLALRNAQTEHWHAVLADAPESWFGPTRVVTGIERFRHSVGHPSGSVVLELATPIDNDNRLISGTGNYGKIHGSMESTVVEYDDEGLSGTSAFIKGRHADQTDALSDNYLDHGAGGARISRETTRMQANLMALHSYSEFGARGFYGSDRRHPAEEHLSDSLVTGSLKLNGDQEQPTDFSAAWRRTDDTYILNRYKPELYQNEHTTDFYGLHVDRRRVVNNLISLDTRLDAEFDKIRSHSLGDHTRGRSSLGSVINLTGDTLTLSLGGSAEFFSTDSTCFLPAAALEWHITDIAILFINYTEALRQPSYTELNYKSPDSLGNNGLERQHTRTGEFGCRSEGDTGKFHLALFYETSSDTVEWVKTDLNSPWRAENVNQIESYGIELDGTVILDENNLLSGYAMLLNKEHSGRYYAGRYNLDYPECVFQMALRHRFHSNFTVKLSQQFAHYATNPVRRGGNWLIDSAIDLQWQPDCTDGLLVNVGIGNILDDDLQYLPGQSSLGRTVHSAVAYNW